MVSPNASGFPIRLFLLIGVGVPALFVVIGSLMLLFWGSVTELDCRRIESQQIKCDRYHRQGGLMTVGETTMAIGTLQGAKVGRQEYTDSDRRSYTAYNILLVVDGEEVPLTQTHTSDYWGRKAAVDEIENFLADESRSSLSIREDFRLNSFILGGIFVVLGTVVGGIFLAVGLNLR